MSRLRYRGRQDEAQTACKEETLVGEQTLAYGQKQGVIKMVG